MKLLLLVTLILLPTDAIAYFDPGTGSILIQVIIGSMATLAVFWKRIKLSIISLFSRNKKKETGKDAAR